MATKFYTYSQNNSGGSFVKSAIDGICEYVIVEATSAEQANAIAENIGLYFDGCETDRDCPCCGDRWYPVDEYNSTKEPSIYNTPVEKHAATWYREECYVHYLDGTVKNVKFKLKK